MTNTPPTHAIKVEDHDITPTPHASPPMATGRRPAGGPSPSAPPPALVTTSESGHQSSSLSGTYNGDLANTWTRAGAVSVRETEVASPKVTEASTPAGRSTTLGATGSGGLDSSPPGSSGALLSTTWGSGGGRSMSPGSPTAGSVSGASKLSFANAAKIVKSTSSVSANIKRKKSAINMHLATEEAKQQLQLEGVAATNEEEEEKALDDHRSKIKDQGNKKKAADVAAEREQSELHQTVNKLVADAEESRLKIKEATQKKLEAERREKESAQKLQDAEEEVSSAKAKNATLLLQLEESNKQNEGLKDEVERSSAKISIQPTLKKKGSTKVVTATALTLVQKYETKFRISVEAYESDFRKMIIDFRNKETLNVIKICTDLSTLRGDREMQDRELEQMHVKVKKLETEVSKSHIETASAKAAVAEAKQAERSAKAAEALAKENEREAKAANAEAKQAERSAKAAEAMARENEREAKAATAEAKKAERSAKAAEALAKENEREATTGEKSARAAALQATAAANNANKELEKRRSEVKVEPEPRAPPPPADHYADPNRSASTETGTTSRRSISPVKHRTERIPVRGLKDIQSPGPSWQQGPHPWYPAGSGTNFHPNAVIRSKSPKLGTHRDYSVGRSQSPGTSMSPPRPSPRQYAPQATPLQRPKTAGGGDGYQGQTATSAGKRRVKSPTVGSPSPPRELLSRTVQQLNSLAADLTREWDE